MGDYEMYIYFEYLMSDVEHKEFVSHESFDPKSIEKHTTLVEDDSDLQMYSLHEGSCEHAPQPVNFAFGHAQLEIRMEFANLKVFKNIVKDYNIFLGREIKWKKNDQRRARAICANSYCCWIPYWAMDSKLNTYQLKTFNPRHTCCMTFQNKAASRDWVVKKLESRLVTQSNVRDWLSAWSTHLY
ncbi:hypothetical protein Lal_00018369 [Lupinus albus]|nr:hypothetical protein Lal_00018369 [Lupinus albus]